MFGSLKIRNTEVAFQNETIEKHKLENFNYLNVVFISYKLTMRD